MYVCPVCGLGACGSQKRVLNPLILELRVVMSHHVSVEKQIWVHGESSQPLNL